MQVDFRADVWRLFAILASLIVADGAGHLLAAEAFPYVAYVIEADTYIRSGPGNQHYATGQLPAGYAVEVYRHDGDGWCAIRPPEGSFSVVPAHQLRVLDSRTAEVVTDGVVARVGSALGVQRNAVQVLLERGEPVQLSAPPTPGEPWIKIAPPAGEFRWIASRRLSKTPPTEGANRPEFGGKWQSQAERAPATQAIAPEQPPADAQGGFDHLSGVNVVKDLADDNSIELITGSPAAVQLVQHQEAVPAGATPQAEASNPAAALERSGQPRIRFPGLNSGGPVDARVAEMQLKLSTIVVQSPTTWQLAALREETAALLAQEQAPQVRDQLRDLLERIATFETVALRYRNGPGATVAASPSNGRLNNSTSAPASATAANAALTGQSGDVRARVRSDLGIDTAITPTPSEPTSQVAGSPGSAGPAEALYDAVGTLKPVVSRREKAPRYALVDDHGDVVTFVTASADVNLQPFVGKRIGVRGSRGFMPEYRRAHVVASRITPLEEKLIR